ncbi:MAG TPA: respiratory nitrate reductase subunit gamma [Desulfomonilaceae bacterium]|nr:respiratory nitrate reductase subunit gamma [Desulfomonilaceae bacterium]HVN81124.1 respiratory nitrate reductase subunit gamma [Terriglobia bacterium]
MKLRSQTSAVAVYAIALFVLTLSLVAFARAEEQSSECLNCHRDRNVNSREGILSSQLFCYNCHQDPTSYEGFRAAKAPRQVKPEYFQKSAHKFVACVQCHTDVARSPHRSLSGVQCISCHRENYGSPGTHAEHLRLRCEACHTDSPFVTLDIAKNEVKLSHTNEKLVPITLAEHKVTDVTKQEFCTKCHTPNNLVGAPAMVLPSKSFVCIVCHYSPLKMGNPVFLIAVCIALIGMVATLNFWFKGRVQDEASSVHKKLQLGSEVVWSKIFSKEAFSIVRTVFFDILLQRRVLANGVSRWFIHSLIYYSFLARFSLSFFTLLLQKLSPEGEWTLTLINKDSSFVAMLNDLLGVFILAGVIWAMVRRYITKPDYIVTEEQDTIALVIIGLVTFSGFVLEGIRLLIVQMPQQIAFSAFAGYFLSRLFSAVNLDWQTIYGYNWYVHALLWALFIAYLPFGKLKHIFTTPVTLLLNYKRT